MAARVLRRVKAVAACADSARAGVEVPAGVVGGPQRDRCFRVVMGDVCDGMAMRAATEA
jgi:hypothetical protein